MLNSNKEIIFKLTFIVSLFVLISAYFIEYILGHQPCNLCLIERVPYMGALVIIIINFQFNHLEKYSILLLIFIFLAGSLISLYHLGIEQGFIKESLVCNLSVGDNFINPEELLKNLKEKPISCKDVTFRLFGLSLATINIFISLIVSVITLKLFLDYEKNK